MPDEGGPRRWRVSHGALKVANPTDSSYQPEVPLLPWTRPSWADKAGLSRQVSPNWGARAVAGPHYFICIGRCGAWSAWTPAFSRYRPGRSKVGYKAGVRDWASQESFVDLEQMWIVPDDALAMGSAGVDHTARGSRNRASWSFLLGPAELDEVG